MGVTEEVAEEIPFSSKAALNLLFYQRIEAVISRM